MPSHDEPDVPTGLLDDALRRIADEYAPRGMPPFSDLVSRRRRRTTWRASAGFAAAAVAVSAVVIGPGLPFANTSAPAVGSTPSGTLPAVLAVGGSCAGLDVTAQWQVEGAPLVTIDFTGGENTVAMAANSLLYFHATGPCLDRLGIHTASDLVQTADPATDGTFNLDGISPLISQPGAGGTAEVDILLNCPDEAACDSTLPVIAVISIEISPSGSQPTGTPSP